MNYQLPLPVLHSLLPGTELLLPPGDIVVAGTQAGLSYAEAKTLSYDFEPELVFERCSAVFAPDVCCVRLLQCILDSKQ